MDKRTISEKFGDKKAVNFLYIMITLIYYSWERKFKKPLSIITFNQQCKQEKL